MQQEAAYISLIKAALARGLTVSVFDGEEWNPKRSSDLNEIQAAVESVEEAHLSFRNELGQQQGRALIIPFGVDPDETVADHSLTPWIDEVMDAI